MVTEHPTGDRRRYIQQIWQSFVITMLGVWVVVLLWVWAIVPVAAPGVWPLLDLPVARIGEKAPAMERDVFISIRGNEQLFLDEQPVTVTALVAALSDTGTIRNGTSYLPNVFVRVDRTAPFRAVRRVIRAAQEAGRPNIVFLAIPSDPDVLITHAPIMSRVSIPPKHEVWLRSPRCTTRAFFAVEPGVDPPIAEHRVIPRFANVSKKLRISSPVMLELFIDSAGEVCVVHVIRGIYPSVDAELAHAVQQWKFKPARRNKEPVACVYKFAANVDVR